jgi:light-regulated signal transduction histidine kinase (bacteriophytochrome)
MDSELKKQLEQTQKELAALRAEYQDFTYIVSHDLSGPLRQVEGFCDIIVGKHGDSFDDKTKRHFELILNGSNKAKQVIDALVEYSRLNTRAQAFELVDCNDVLNDLKNQLSSDFEHCSPTIECPPLPIISADKVQIAQLFYHLIHNALLYHLPDSKPEVVISFIETEHSWRFEVKDNGIGIAQNLQEKVFKVLRRGVSDKAYVGMGMGLAIATKILQRHKGTIWLESDKTIGTTVHFTIQKGLLDE